MASPKAGLLSDGSGNLWGTSLSGGLYGYGAVYKVNVATGAVTIMVSFDNSKDATDNSRGGGPQAGLVSDGAGNLWGTTSGGGASGYGTVFKVNVSTGAITTVVDFDNSTSMTDNSRGAHPEAGLVSDGAGNLWGTTCGLGGNGYGTVFKVNMSTGAITTVVDFDYSRDASDNSRGAQPLAGLVSDGAGNLWGTTFLGGASGFQAGTVYKVNVATGAITTVVDFDGTGTTTDNSRGASPEAGLVSDGAGNLWGTTDEAA